MYTLPRASEACRRDVPFVSLQPEDTLASAMSPRQKSKIDDIWARMNASEASRPGGASGNETSGGKGKEKTKKKKKAIKKANKVTEASLGMGMFEIGSVLCWIERCASSGSATGSRSEIFYLQSWVRGLPACLVWFILRTYSARVIFLVYWLSLN